MSTPTESPFLLGQEVLYFDGYTRGGPRPTKIVKVGRAYVYTEDGPRSIPFDKQTGIERTTATSVGTPARIKTREMHEADERRGNVVKELQRLNVFFRNYGGSAYSTDTLEQVAEILLQDPNAPQEKSA